ncbi:hypothetical protein BC829DRAFT_388861 [Chytridium lagenaria]|nr:hypothetical protein BC829DRAFT_388861 [Chytridium lagenaria]
MIGQRLLWDTIGYLLVLRSPSREIFYPSLAGNVACTLLERLVACYILWRQVKVEPPLVHNSEEVVDSTASTLSPHDPLKSATTLSQLTGYIKTIGDEQNEASDAADGMALGAFDPKNNATWRKASATPSVKKMQFSLSVRSSLSMIGGRSSARVSSVFDEAADDDEMIEDEYNCTAVKELNDKTPPTPPGLMNIPHDLPLFEEDTRKTENSHIFIDTSIDRNSMLIGDERPFVPQHLTVKHGFFRIGLMQADMAAFMSSSVIVLLFATLPDASTWAASYYALSLPIFVERVLVKWVVLMIFDAISLAIDEKMLGINFRDSFEEAKAVSLTVSSDTGLMYDNISYRPGRKR